MNREVGQRHKIGITRAIKGMMSVAEQTEQLVAFGVDPHHIWQYKGSDFSDIARAFRPVPGDDLLVVAHCGFLGPKWVELLADIGQKGADLYDLKNDKLVPLRGFEHAAYVKAENIEARSTPGRVAAEGKGGRKKTPREIVAKAKLAWEGTEGSNEEVAQEIGRSVDWFQKRFGGRKAAQARAAKRMTNK